MSNKQVSPKSEAGLTRGVVSYVLGSVSIIMLLEPKILERIIPPGLWPWVDRFWFWLMALPPVLGLFFGAIGIRSRGKYIAILGIILCIIALGIISVWLGLWF
jgi:hypothetical protein